jgi:DMSO/TMAO reductase YedYZ molybdopterin-dependent catalytic subunit
MPSDAQVPPGQRLLPELKVKHYGRIPRGEAAGWTMIFTAETRTPGAPPRETGRLDVPELADLPQIRVTTDLHCASGWSVQELTWEGVPSAALLERFPPPAGSAGVLAYAEYGYSTNLRIADLLQPTSLLATRLDGAPLSPEHGRPVRLVVPHLYAYKSPKWFRGWEYLATRRRGFWEERGYHVIGDPWTEQRYSYLE